MIDASADIADYKAQQCGRVAVPVQRLLEDMCDAPAWLFSEQRHSAGLDPWTQILSVDCRTDGAVFWCDVPGNRYVTMRPDDRVFVQIKDLPEPLK